MLWIMGEHYYWPSWRKDVTQYVWNCHECHQAENPQDKHPGLLKPLPILNCTFCDILMDFHSFPKDCHGFDTTLVVVCHLTKRPISILCTKEMDAKELAHLFTMYFYWYYGAPDTIISD